MLMNFQIEEDDEDEEALENSAATAAETTNELKMDPRWSLEMKNLKMRVYQS